MQVCRSGSREIEPISTEITMTLSYPSWSATLSSSSIMHTQTHTRARARAHTHTHTHTHTYMYTHTMLRKTSHSLELYEQLVCFVMAYSFTDAEERDVCAETMMVPFVDLLNHHSLHHTELRFHTNHLQLVAVRNIQQV